MEPTQLLVRASGFCFSVAAAAALTVAPVTHADMPVGNYTLQSNRDSGHTWTWAIRRCTLPEPGCSHIQAIPQPNGQAASYDGDARLANGRYTMTIDVPDGVRCVVYFLPSHDVYSWDATTLTGQVDSTFDSGCGGAPGGTVSYPFSLTRL
jgi:hypothetical protein